MTSPKPPDPFTAEELAERRGYPSSNGLSQEERNRWLATLDAFEARYVKALLGGPRTEREMWLLQEVSSACRLKIDVGQYEELRIYACRLTAELAAAKVESLRKLPNGWQQPTFMSVGDDGSLRIEWCFGAQGSPESFRIAFYWDVPGPVALRTRHDGQDVVQDVDETETATMTLARWLTEASGK